MRRGVKAQVLPLNQREKGGEGSSHDRSKTNLFCTLEWDKRFTFNQGGRETLSKVTIAEGRMPFVPLLQRYHIQMTQDQHWVSQSFTKLGKITESGDSGEKKG